MKHLFKILTVFACVAATSIAVADDATDALEAELTDAGMSLEAQCKNMADLAGKASKKNPDLATAVAKKAATICPEYAGAIVLSVSEAVAGVSGAPSVQAITNTVASTSPRARASVSNTPGLPTPATTGASISPISLGVSGDNASSEGGDTTGEATVTSPSGLDG